MISNRRPGRTFSLAPASSGRIQIFRAHTMITHLRRFFWAVPARGGISVPAALLVLGVALSCSTACITSAVVGSIDASRRQAEADRADAARKAASAQLMENVRRQAGDRTEIVSGTDSASLEIAFRRALPTRDLARDGSGLDGVEVKLSQDSRGRDIYTIKASGAFVHPYELAFAEYADRLHHQLGGRQIFDLEVWSTVGGASRMVLVRRFF